MPTKGYKEEEYIEGELFSKSLVQTLQQKSGVESLVNGNYSSFYGNVYRFISKKKGGSEGGEDDDIIDISYNRSTNQLIATKRDGSTETLSLNDRFVQSLNYNEDSSVLSLSLNDGSAPLTVDLNIDENYYTKGEIDEKIIEKVIHWDEFD